MAKNKKEMPKGGSKGGTRFPRLTLKKAVIYSKKLVSKTHTGPQTAKIILPGVFDAGGPIGQVRASALKQYALLEGTPRNYQASSLAKRINSATANDMPNCLKEAFIKPPLFKKIFDTFCDDKVTRAKIRQQASTLKVHPDSLDECVSVFVESAIYAGLACEEADLVKLQAIPKQLLTESIDTDEDTNDEQVSSDTSTKVIDTEDTGSDEDVNKNGGIRSPKPTGSRTNVDIKIDPSMDPEKLDKLLGVLKKYGQI